LTSKKPKKTEKHYAAGKNKPAAVAAHASGLPFHLEKKQNGLWRDINPLAAWAWPKPRSKLHAELSSRLMSQQLLKIKRESSLWTTPV